mgnify:CR=1 FL=1
MRGEYRVRGPCSRDDASSCCRDLLRVMTLGVCASLAFSVLAQGAELSLRQSPLALGGGVPPNVFLMLDNSLSMDQEIQTDRHSVGLFYWVPLKHRYMYGIKDKGPTRAGEMDAHTMERRRCDGKQIATFVYMYDTSKNVDNRALGGCSLESRPLAGEADWRFYTASHNYLFYNPEVEYSPWEGYPPADFKSARSSPVAASPGYTARRNLEGFRYDVWEDTLGFKPDSKGQPAGPESVTPSPNGKVDLWDNHVSYKVGATSIRRESYKTSYERIKRGGICTKKEALRSPPFAACFGTTSTVTVIGGSSRDAYGRTLSETKQNIANWYQYHRRRIYAMKSVIAEVLSKSPHIRIGLDSINELSGTFSPMPAESATARQRETHNNKIRDAFLAEDRLIRSTPLRQALERVGHYYADLDGKYRTPITSACQQNFAILFSDGQWNGGNPRSSLIYDNDGDSQPRRLADVALHFYKRDLSPLPNQVPVSEFDTNNAQHMVTFTVSFGQTGTLVDTDSDGWPNPPLKMSDRWFLPGSDARSRAIDDLWHAAFNSRGQYVSAKNSGELAAALEQFLGVIAAGAGSVTPLAVSSTSLRTGSLIFRSSLNSEGWTGELEAYVFKDNSEVSSTPKWRASAALEAQDADSGRTIITSRATAASSGAILNTGVPFRFPSRYESGSSAREIDEEMLFALLANAPFKIELATTASQIRENQAYGEALVDYLRGSRDTALAKYNFRKRELRLGDIAGSQPRFVGRRGDNSVQSARDSDYFDFLDAIATRKEMVYVGANDGFLHGFSVLDGKELLAFAPSSLAHKLPLLASPRYSHRFYVDASPTVVDAKIGRGSANAWRTVLASGLGAGGQAIFALDVTAPETFSERNANEIFLWEFSDRDDADMGYSYSAPQLAKLENGRWVAVFGNGYNSIEAEDGRTGTGSAVLFIVDLLNGELIRKITTKAGSLSSPNGLSTPVLVDADGNGAVERAYAGDLAGNLWEFDLAASSPSNWRVAQGSAERPAPLFITSNKRPITSQPTASAHPDGLGGVMVFFGTGKYLEELDNQVSGQPTHSLYGIWDRDDGATSTIAESTILRQQIIDQRNKISTSVTGGYVSNVVREVTQHEIDWGVHRGWRLLLRPEKLSGVTNTQNFGERQISPPTLRKGRLYFTTFQPQSDSCGSIGRSFLMQLDYRNGGMKRVPVFDLNNDGKFDSVDGVVAGMALRGGVLGEINLVDSKLQLHALGAGWESGVLDTAIRPDTELYGRQSWRQLE